MKAPRRPLVVKPEVFNIALQEDDKKHKQTLQQQQIVFLKGQFTQKSHWKSGNLFF